MYWEINKVFSYNKLFNFIVGARGVGKTYGAKKKAIERFIKKNEQFIYLRRYKEELAKISKFFDDINNEFPDIDFEVKGNDFYINGMIAGSALALTQAKKEKSVPYPRVSMIIFDEFIIEAKGYSRYLTNEVSCFLEEYSTIARDRDVIVFFLSNALTISNPYFIYFDIFPSKNEFTVKGDILIQSVKDNEYIDKMNNTRFGKLIQGTEYGDYAISNEFLLDNNDFIAKKNENYRFLFSFNYSDKNFGVWYNYRQGTYIVSNDIDPSGKLHYCFSMDDHSTNTILLRGNTSPIIKGFIDTYKRGGVFFESVNIKNIVNKVIKITL